MKSKRIVLRAIHIALCSLAFVGCVLPGQEDDGVGSGRPAREGTIREAAVGVGDGQGRGPSASGPASSACGIRDHEPNDGRDQAVPLTLGVEIIGCTEDGDDRDWYEITAPRSETNASGYFSGKMTGLKKHWQGAKIYTRSDNGEIAALDEVVSDGELDLFWSAASGQTFNVATYPTLANLDDPWAYGLTLRYTEVEDPLEPNDTPEEAAPIPLGNLSAFFFGGYSKNVVPSADDWYSVVLSEGTVSIRVQEVPETLRPSVEVIAPDGAKVPVTGAESANRGANIDATATLLEPGQYKIHLKSGAADFAVQGVVPDHFTRAYQLTVTQ